jgi:hypothetical protein
MYQTLKWFLNSKNRVHTYNSSKPKGLSAQQLHFQRHFIAPYMMEGNFTKCNQLVLCIVDHYTMHLFHLPK